MHLDLHLYLAAAGLRAPDDRSDLGAERAKRLRHGWRRPYPCEHDLLRAEVDRWQDPRLPLCQLRLWCEDTLNFVLFH